MYIYIYIYIYILYPLDQRVESLPMTGGSIPGRVIPKTQKMVLDTSLLNTQYNEVRIKGNVEQFREKSAPSLTPRYSSN